MPRHRVIAVVDKTDPADRRVIVPSATVYIYAEGTTTPVTVWDAKVGGSALTQPLTTDLVGRVCGLLGEEVFVSPASLDLKATDPLTGEEISIPYEAVSATDLGGALLAHVVKSDTNPTSTSTTEPYTNIAGLVTPTLALDGRPVIVEVIAGRCLNDTANGGGIVGIYRDDDLRIDRAYWSDSVANAIHSVHLLGYDTPAAGNWVYRATLGRSSATGTASIGTSTQPARLIVRYA